MKMKNDIIEIGDFEEEENKETARIKWRDFEVYYLIAIQGEMNKKFAKTANI